MFGADAPLVECESLCFYTAHSTEALNLLEARGILQKGDWDIAKAVLKE